MKTLTIREVLDKHVQVDEATGCWLWRSHLNWLGYGTLTHKGKHGLAHRLIFIELKEDVPRGLTLDHLCRVRRCVNPDHLEVVSLKENLRRGESPSALHGRQTHCLRGHPLAGANLYKHPQGARVCRTCMNESIRRYQRRKKEELLAY